MGNKFIVRTLNEQVRMHVYRTEKFKTLSLRLVICRPLQEQQVTKTALLPWVLRRGSRSLPTSRAVMTKMEELYGSVFNADVSKIGERQMIVLSADLTDPPTVPDRGRLLEEGMGVLFDILQDPVSTNGAFQEEYVAQEKEALRRHIKGLVNDKMNYAMVRCIEEMCKNEPFALIAHGRVADLDEIDATGLYAFYQQVLAESPCDLYVVGNVTPAEVEAWCRPWLARLQRSNPFPIPGPSVEASVAAVRMVDEVQDIGQGKLHLGFRTHVPRTSPDYFGLQVANGILGGFAHSKLFQNVREKASLAYYAFSRLEGSKGLIVIGAGIDARNFDQALDIIKAQVEAIKSGQISDDELEYTKHGLLNHYRELIDSPGGLIAAQMEADVNGITIGLEEHCAALSRVSKDDVVRAVTPLELDTIYFLHGPVPASEDGGGQNA